MRQHSMWHTFFTLCFVCVLIGPFLCQRYEKKCRSIITSGHCQKMSYRGNSWTNSWPIPKPTFQNLVWRWQLWREIDLQSLNWCFYSMHGVQANSIDATGPHHRRGRTQHVFDERISSLPPACTWRHLAYRCNIRRTALAGRELKIATMKDQSPIYRASSAGYSCFDKNPVWNSIAYVRS
jgi:hypothetical protein